MTGDDLNTSNRRIGDFPLVLLGNGLDNLEQIPPRIFKEGDAKAHCGYIVWLAGDRHVAMLQFVDDIVNTIDAETGVVPARHVVTVMQILISGAFCRARAISSKWKLSSPAG